MRRERTNRETVIQQQVMLAIGGRPDVRIWRNNRGKARRRLRDGSLGRPIEFGLAPGASDLLGIVAGGRLLSVEVKTPEAFAGKDNGLTPDQQKWRDIVVRFGGLYFVTCSAEDAVAQLEAALCEPAAFQRRPASEPGACSPFESSGAYIGR